MRHLSRENAEYNDEANFLDGLYEFHPGLFDVLGRDALQDLRSYYSLGSPLSVDFRDYRRNAMESDDGIQGRAKRAFDQVCRAAGVEQFTYTTQWDDPEGA